MRYYLTTCMAAIFLFASTAIAQGPYNEVEFRIARLAANEAGLQRLYDRDQDTYLIALVTTRNAEFRSMDVISYIETYHHRHMRASRHANRWILGLNVDLTMPAYWPESRVCWDSCEGTSGRDRWEARLREAHDFFSGTRPVCSLQPITWGGPVTDGEALLRKLISGRFRVVSGPVIPDVVIRDQEGAVIEVLHEPAGARREEEQCLINDDPARTRNVYIARAR